MSDLVHDQLNEHGIMKFLSFDDLDGNHVTVSESKLATGPACWIFGDFPGVHLTPDMAREVRSALGRWLGSIGEPT